MARAPQIRIAVDVGGTFTDGIAELSPGGRIHVAKRLTTAADPGRAVSEVVSDLLAGMANAEPRTVSEVVHGTTLVTNTIIERRGARTGALVTRGTRDVLSIGRETRYDLYDLDLEMPEPLVPRRLREEVDERLVHTGEVVTPLDEVQLGKAIARLAGRSVESIAVCFLHAYANPKHERAARRTIRKALPGVAVTIASDLAAVMKEYERMSTATANAYVQPLVARYLSQLERRLRRQDITAPLRVMVSSGGFTSSKAAAELPILLLESGPAGGVLSALNTAREAGVDDLLALDMGGTTAKACVSTAAGPDVAHEFETSRVRRFMKGSGLPMLIPSMDLVNENMAGAARVHVAEKGMDPRRFTLVATGGAGPVHAVEVAHKLGMRRVLCTVAAGAGSCLGLLAAPARVDRSWSRVQRLGEVSERELARACQRMHDEAARSLEAAGAKRVRWTLGAEVRYVGQGNAVDVTLPYRPIGPATLSAVRRAFEKRYRALYGALVPGATPEVVTWRLTGQSPMTRHAFRLPVVSGRGRPAPLTTRTMYLAHSGESARVPVYERYRLRAGTKLEGPLVLQERESTIVLPRPGEVEVLAHLTVSIHLA